MKKTLLIIILYLSLRLYVTERCMSVYGWEYYSLLPTPTCRVGEQTFSLHKLEKIMESKQKIKPSNIYSS